MKTLLQMRTKIFVTLLSIVMVILFTVWQAIALGPDTHSNINEYIAQNNNLNNFSLDGYLKNQLGIQEGIKSYFKSGYLDQQVYKWVGDGGTKEDAGFRSLNHFLNLLTDKGILGYYSALQWATLSMATQSFSPFASWNDVRSYYFKALTSVDKTTRDDNFAVTFQGIGQIMHLVKDMEV